MQGHGMWTYPSIRQAKLTSRAEKSHVSPHPWEKDKLVRGEDLNVSACTGWSSSLPTTQVPGEEQVKLWLVGQGSRRQKCIMTLWWDINPKIQKYINVNSLLVSDPFLKPESSLPGNIIGRRYGNSLKCNPKAKMDDPSRVRKNKNTN